MSRRVIFAAMFTRAAVDIDAPLASPLPAARALITLLLRYYAAAIDITLVIAFMPWLIFAFHCFSLITD